MSRWNFIMPGGPGESVPAPIKEGLPIVCRTREKKGRQDTGCRYRFVLNPETSGEREKFETAVKNRRIKCPNCSWNIVISDGLVQIISRNLGKK